jgi:hypothetical protein
MTFCARNFAVLSGLAAVAFGYSTALAQEREITPALIQKTMQGNFQEFLDMLALPNDSVNAENNPQECRLAGSRISQARLCHQAA